MSPVVHTRARALLSPSVNTSTDLKVELFKDGDDDEVNGTEETAGKHPNKPTIGHSKLANRS